jgi:hypothetical protein
MKLGAKAQKFLELKDKPILAGSTKAARAREGGRDGQARGDMLLEKMMSDPVLLARIQFAAALGIFILASSVAFSGLAYSMVPFRVVDRPDIRQAAAAPESLMIILVGVAIVLPMVIGCTVFSCRVFRGKARALTYY